MIRLSLTCLAYFALTAASAAAPHLETRPYPYTLLPPGEIASGILKCSEGTLISGGYLLDNAPNGRVDILVTGNYPSNADKWRVNVKNVANIPVSGTFHISILCE